MKLILLFLLSVISVFGSNDEIGIPIVDWKKGQIESAVLASNGKSFYTLQGQDLIHWNLSPLQKIKGWKLPLVPVNSGTHLQNYHNLHFIDKYKRVLVSSIDELLLFNMETNIVEKRTACRNHTLVQDGDILYMARIDKKGDRDENAKLVVRPDLHLEVWNIPKLKKIKSINVTKESGDFFPNLLSYRGEGDLVGDFLFQSRYQGQLMVSENFIYYFAVTHKVAVIDKHKMKLIKMIWEENPVKKTSDGLLVMGTKIYKQSTASLVLEFPRNDFKSVKKFLSESSRRPIMILPLLAPRSKITSLVGSLYLKYGKPSAPYIFYRKGKGFIARIGQYKGKLIMLDRNMNFEVSSKEFELLKMKNKTNKIVPINRTTFKKYNKLIQLKDK